MEIAMSSFPSEKCIWPRVHGGFCLPLILAAILLVARGVAMVPRPASQAVDAETASRCSTNCPYFTQVWQGDAQLRAAADRLLDAKIRKSAPWFPLLGTEAVVSPVRKNDTTYLMMTECQPHSCPDHAFFLLYDPASQQLEILYVQPKALDPDAVRKRWLGNPTALEKDLLAGFAKGRIVGN